MLCWQHGCNPAAQTLYCRCAVQVYKGVLSPGEFNAMTDELTSGPCIAFEVADRDGADCVEQVSLCLCHWPRRHAERAGLRVSYTEY